MKISKRISRKIKKAAVTVSVIANTLALNITASAETGGSGGTGAPAGVDTTNYNTVIDIIFWAAGILILAGACIPGFKAMADGQANEDKRGFNAGLVAVITGAVCAAGCVAIRYLFL